ncbi:MAG TPA: hypothetical protein VGL81_32385 [Polyangiaceae bacterium]
MGQLSDEGIEQRISGHDFVRAMMLAGFRFVRAMDRHVLIAKGGTRLLVPQPGVLDEETILALLREASLAVPDFATLLNRLGSRDTWLAQSEAEIANGSPWRLRVSR